MQNIRESEEWDSDIKQWVGDSFQQFCVLIGKSKSHVMRTQFKKDVSPIKQKGRRIPLQLQQRVEAELSKLIDQKHIFKSGKGSDRQLIRPIVSTVQKDQTAKLALDSKKLIKFNHNNKYQMPTLDLLRGNITHVVKLDNSKQTLFLTLDLRYAYSQKPLDKSTREP